MDIKQIIKNTNQRYVFRFRKYLCNISLVYVLTFSNLPCSDDIQLNQLLEQLDNKLTINLQKKRQKSKQQRQLAQFQSYFTF